MQSVLIGLLMAVVLASVVAMVVTSLRQYRRRMRLGQLASQHGLRFSVDDPFDVPRRYADFALIASGHSPAASNFIFGHIEGLPVREFDFQYEVGHGTRRLTRRYGVILLEMPSDPGSLLMWHEDDSPPVSAGQACQQFGPWSFCGARTLAEAVAATGQDLFDKGGCVEVRRSVMLLAVPAPLGPRKCPTQLASIATAIRKLI